MRQFFCGWYFRCQSERHTLALIPSIHQTETERYGVLQLITPTQAFSVTFPGSCFQKDGSTIRIGRNQFSPKGIRLSLHTPELRATGAIRFGAFTPLRYDIMGPFRYVPNLECRHSVFSMRHRVDGILIVNSTPFVFQDGVGYMEGDRGCSFPKHYAWTQCSFPEGALMLSAADIPLGGFCFTGIIGVVLLHGKEYRLATYLGARAEKTQGGEIIIRQRSLCLTVRRLDQPGQPLQAPAHGAMARTIHEHPSCKVYYQFRRGNVVTLLERELPNAAMEYEYP